MNKELYFRNSNQMLQRQSAQMPHIQITAQQPGLWVFHILPTRLLGDRKTMFLPAPHLLENLVIGVCVSLCVCMWFPKISQKCIWQKNIGILRRILEEPEKAKDIWKECTVIYWEEGWWGGILNYKWEWICIFIKSPAQFGLGLSDQDKWVKDDCI